MKFPMIVAYNMPEKKIGCVLAQAALGGTLSGGELSFHFDTDLWELNPSKCKLFEVRNQEEFDCMKEITHETHEKERCTKDTEDVEEDPQKSQAPIS